MPKNNLKNSPLGRSEPKRNTFHTLITKGLTRKRHQSDTGLVEDNASSTIIIRVIVGLLLIHVVLIGGALVHGEIKKSNGGDVVTASITTPPATATAPVAGPTFPDATARPAVRPGTVDVTAVRPGATAQARPHTPAQNHITQVAPADDDAEEVTAPARPAAPVQPANTVMVKHLVASGETWSSIAMANNTDVETLKAANPAAARKINLVAGSYLQVPVAKDSAQARAEADRAAAAPQPRVHVVTKGETLGGIAKKEKISLKKLMQINNMSDKDAARIRPGQKIKVSE